MKDGNIYNDLYKQHNLAKMSERQQTLYLMEKTKNEDYCLEKDIGLIGKSRRSVEDVDFSELFEQQKKRAVIFLVFSIHF